MDAFLRNIHSQAKGLITATNEQSIQEKQNLLKKLQRYGLINADAIVDQILGLTLHDVMKRRLQTLVVKKGLAKTVKQARQMITHKHIAVGEKKISSPSYLVTLEEEGVISYAPSSAFSNVEHAERVTMHTKA